MRSDARKRTAEPDAGGAVLCPCGEPVGHVDHCGSCCGCGAASEHEHMATVEHLRRRPICDMRFTRAEPTDIARVRRTGNTEADWGDRAETAEARLAAALGEHCREDLPNSERCNESADFILWGKLFPPEALGPRCYAHAIDHTSHWMPSQADQWAVYDLRRLRAAADASATEGGEGRG